MIRVLHVLGALNPGGVETWLMNVLRYIDLSRFQLDFCTFGPEKGVFAAEAESLGSVVYSCPIEEGTLSLGRRFRKIVREGRYNVVHSHVHHFSGAVLRWAAAEGVAVRISHSHSSMDGQPNTLARKAYRRMMQLAIRRYATNCLAASQTAASALYGESWQLDPHVQVLYYGIDLKPFEENNDWASLRQELGIPQGAFVIGHVGRFVEPKNHAFLLEIAFHLVSRDPKYHFLLVGEGPLRGQMESRAKEHGMAENVHFAGARCDVPRLMLGAMDAFVFPSLWEGLPMTILEAQAAGLPCIISNRITPEVVVFSNRVTLCALESPVAQWSAHFMNIQPQAGPERRAKIGQFARCNFTIQHSVKALMGVYDKAESN